MKISGIVIPIESKIKKRKRTGSTVVCEQRQSGFLCMVAKVAREMRDMQPLFLTLQLRGGRG